MSQKTFHIGLCMAGAVSAGAYTAGVVDFLLEALEAWELKRGQENVPTHRVMISVIGGASAGGMTGIIAASTANNQITPVRQITGNILAQQPQNKLYHSWVDQVEEDMFPLLLNTSDIQDKHIPSLFNSNFIDQIAQRALLVDGRNWVQPKYLSTNLKVFTTLSNLEGYEYDITFKSNATSVKKFLISEHGDFACFKLNTEEYSNDGWIPLNFKTGFNVSLARDAAMATGAFPLGLKSRPLVRESLHVNENPWLRDITTRTPVPNKHYPTLNVDGGMINNEPFEKVRDVLSDITSQRLKVDYEDYDKFESTVLMVDPFPSEHKEFKPDDNLFKVLGLTFKAVTNQMKAKRQILEDAEDSENAAQFLIAPVTERPNNSGDMKIVQGDKAIACGAFGGFSGFLRKEFRIHDYFLGRANCEKFLRDHFTVPEDCTNPIFQDGYSTVQNKIRYKATDGSLQIIPVFKEKTASKYMPTLSSGGQWPVINEKDINRFRPMLKRRAQSILFNMGKLGKLEHGLLWIGSKVLINGKIADTVLEQIKKSLNEHALLK